LGRKKKKKKKSWLCPQLRSLPVVAPPSVAMVAALDDDFRAGVLNGVCAITNDVCAITNGVCAITAILGARERLILEFTDTFCGESN
jgi:hypothetical protein